jgi:hypothetical protein
VKVGNPAVMSSSRRTIDVLLEDYNVAVWNFMFGGRNRGDKRSGLSKGSIVDGGSDRDRNGRKEQRELSRKMHDEEEQLFDVKRGSNVWDLSWDLWKE